MPTARTRIRLTALALAALTGLTLSACSSDTGSAGTRDVKGPGPGHYETDLGGYSGPAPTASPITLRLMRQSWSDAANKAFDEGVAAFREAYPNITVKQELVPYGDLSTKLQTYIASGNVPDIVMGRSDFVASYMFGDVALPVGDYFTPAFKADYTPSLRDSVTVDGTMYALPWEHQVQLLAYNKDIFAKAGVPTPPRSTDPNDGWTVDQWFDAFAKLRAWMDRTGHKDMYPLAPSGFGNGGPGSNYAQLESTWIRMQGSATAPKDSDEYKAFTGVSADGLNVDGFVNNPLAVKGMRNYQQLFTQHWSPTDYVPNMFKTGTAAVDVGGITSGGGDFAWGLTPLPKVRSVVSSNASDSFIVSDKSKHPAEAAALLGALTNVKEKLSWHQAWGSLPSQQSVIKALPASTRDSEKFQLVSNMAAATVGAPRSPGWFEYFNQMNTTVRDIGLGADVQKSLDAAVTAIDRRLAEYER